MRPTRAARGPGIAGRSAANQQRRRCSAQLSLLQRVRRATGTGRGPGPPRRAGGAFFPQQQVRCHSNVAATATWLGSTAQTRHPPPAPAPVLHPTNSGSDGADSSTDDEMQAKAAVMDLLAHPEEVARKLRAAAQERLARLKQAAGRGGAEGDSVSGGGSSFGINVAWLKALVNAATRGDVGTVEHQRQLNQRQRRGGSGQDQQQ
jgi:hypothetical protein